MKCNIEYDFETDINFLTELENEQPYIELITPDKCTCDLQKVIMVTGCVCGGK